jgi:hypothetical protein
MSRGCTEFQVVPRKSRDGRDDLMKVREALVRGTFFY